MKILFYGDSITDMGRSRDFDKKAWGYGVGYPSFVAGTLLKDEPEKYEFINRGISGNRIVDLYARIKADVWNLQPDVLPSPRWRGHQSLRQCRHPENGRWSEW